MSIGVGSSGQNTPTRNSDSTEYSLGRNIRRVFDVATLVAKQTWNYYGLERELSAWVDEANETTDIENRRQAKSVTLKIFWGFGCLLPFGGLGLQSIPPCLDYLKIDSAQFDHNQLSYMPIEKRSEAFLKINFIEILCLCSNGLRSLEGFRLETFKNLITLNLQSNRLGDCRSLPKLSNLPQLKNLFLSFCDLQSVEGLDARGAVNLVYLSLDNNSIESVSQLDFSDCNNLTTLHVTENRLRRFDAILPSSPNNQVNIYLYYNLFSPDYVADLNSNQNASGYTGPVYFLSVMESLFSMPSKSEIPVILKAWNRVDCSEGWLPLNQLMKAGGDASVYMNFILFLSRLWNEAPKGDDGERPIRVVDTYMLEVLDVIELLYPSCELLKACIYIAEEAVSTCSDRMRIGLLQMLLRARIAKAEEYGSTKDVLFLQENLSWVQRITAFVSDINEGKIVYNESLNCFQDLEDVDYVKVRFGDAKRAIDCLSQEDRFRLISECIQNNVSIHMYHIGDEVEDILQILNGLKSVGLSVVEDLGLSYQNCVTLSARQTEVFNYFKKRYSVE